MVNKKIENVILDLMSNQKSFSAFDVTNETRKQNPSLFLIHSQIKTTIHQTIKQNLSRFNYQSDMKTVGKDSFVYYSPISSKSNFDILNEIQILKLNDSSFIENAFFDAKNKELKIDFKNGKSYIYQGVNEAVAEEIVEWDSVGEFFNMYIKGKFPFVIV